MNIKKQADIKFYLTVMLTFGLAGVFLLPFCNLMFKCGCRLPWAGGVDFCNINTPGVPHCPWCEEHNWFLQAAPFIAVFAGQAGSMFYLHRKFGWPPAGLLIVGCIVFLVLATLNGLFFKIISDYPYFF